MSMLSTVSLCSLRGFQVSFATTIYTVWNIFTGKVYFEYHSGLISVVGAVPAARPGALRCSSGSPDEGGLRPGREPLRGLQRHTPARARKEKSKQVTKATTNEYNLEIQVTNATTSV